MKNLQVLFLVIVICFVLSACDPSGSNVVSLGETAMPADENEILDHETMMMEYTACLRNEGLEVSDPVINADGEVEKPQLSDNISKDDLLAANEVCAPLLDGFTFGKKEEDLSQEVDNMLILAACLREEGITIDDPTAETLDTWQGDLKSALNFDDPSQVQVYENCSGGDTNTGGKK